MQIESTRLGTIEIEQDKIINFPQGVPGFEDEKQFVLIPLGDDNPFYFLQSVATADLCFIVVEPYVFFKNYEVELSDEVVESLSLKSEEEVAIYTIVTIKDDIKTATTNLQAPIIANSAKLLAKQYIVDNNKFLIRQPLFPDQTEQISNDKVDKGE